MTHVKWLQSITVVDEPFRGWQQEVAYHLRESEDEPGRPVTRILPRSLMIPPGIPDFLTQGALPRAGPVHARGAGVVGLGAGRAGRGERGRRRELGRRRASASRRPSSPGAAGATDWDAEPGEHELCCRATDAAGNAQPIERRVELRRLLQQRRPARPRGRFRAGRLDRPAPPRFSRAGRAFLRHPRSVREPPPNASRRFAVRA